MSFRWGRRRASQPAPPVREERSGSVGTSSSPSYHTSSFQGSSTSLRPPAAAHASPGRRATSAALEQLRQQVRPEDVDDILRGRNDRGGHGSSSAPAYPGVGPTTSTASLGTGPTASPVARSSTPPPYAHHRLDRSPLPNPMALDDRPRVPPPIFLRSSSNQPQSKLGSLKIHVPAWGISLVRPPRPYDMHPLEAGGGREPPAEDTVVSGMLEVTMKERRRVQAISVGVQSVCRLNMLGARSWEEDGIFERGVEVLSGDGEDGIWLEKGTQSFSFSILLPATLATHDYHSFGRISYVLTARVEGVPVKGGLSSMFKNKEIPVQGGVPFLSDFLVVIARSDRVGEHAQGMSRSGSRDGSPAMSPLTNGMSGMGLDPPSPFLSPSDEAVISLGESAGPLRGGLYHRRASSDMNMPGSPQSPATALAGLPRPSPLRKDTDQASIMSRESISNESKNEKNGWLMGDICVIRGFKVHANPSPTGGAYQLEIRKEGYVDGLGPWKFNASSDAFSIASVMLLKLTIPSPSPACTIFFVRVILSQNYEMYSPRTPNDPPVKPEGPKNHVVYQVGRPHKSGETTLGYGVEALYRGTEAGGTRETGPVNGWRTRVVARLPNHEKIRPSTNPGTITPIRVTHELLLRIFYSIENETVAGKPLRTPSGGPLKGPGEVRMCQVRLPITVPSCLCSTAALNLPTYECAADDPSDDADMDPTKICVCSTPFAELSASTVRRQQNPNELSDEETPPLPPFKAE